MHARVYARTVQRNVRKSRGRVDSSALTAVIPVVALLPAWFVATSLCFAIASIPFDPGYLTFMLIAAGGSVVMFVPLTQRLFVTRLLGVRSPTRDEAKRLEAAVRVVGAAAGNPDRRFVLAVDESDDVNAFACGGHILVVSSFAIRELDDDELTGVVAHEYGHHLGAHTIGLSFAQWFSLPVIVFARVGRFLHRIADSQHRRYDDQPGPNAYAWRLVTIGLTCFAWLFQASLFAAQRLNNFAGRDAEFQADRRVVALGFGRQLSRALEHAAAREGSSLNRTWHERIFSSHPPARTRIARIEAMLRSRRR